MSIPKSIFLLNLELFALLILTGCSGVPTQSQVFVTTLPNPNPTTAGGPASAPSGSVVQTAIPTQENPLVPEANPVGDIPDSQAFVNYIASSSNYSLDVPEGWARTNTGSDVRFVNKFDGLGVSITQSASAPTVDSIRKNEIATLTNMGRAFQVGQITEMDLPGGHAIKISATVNSEPDPVTSKQVRLEEDIYIFFRNGTEAMLQLWAPQGADNVDQWKRISESFQWK
jgi:hypothetical protein